MKFKKILVPVDFSDFSKKALQAAIDLALCCKGRIQLLHVEEDIFHVKQMHKIHPPMENICDEMHKEFIIQKKQALEKFRSYIPKKLFAGAVIKEGHAFVEIVRFAKKQCIDMIIMSSHGRTGLRHVFLGSTADKVSRKAGCAVLIVKDKTCKFQPL